MDSLIPFHFRCYMREGATAYGHKAGMCALEPQPRERLTGAMSGDFRSPVANYQQRLRRTPHFLRTLHYTNQTCTSKLAVPKRLGGRQSKKPNHRVHDVARVKERACPTDSVPLYAGLIILCTGHQALERSLPGLRFLDAEPEWARPLHQTGRSAALSSTRGRSIPVAQGNCMK